MPFASNDTVKLFYEERGQGDPVLLIMGYAAKAVHWGEEFRDLMAAHYRIVSFDNRGTGDSDKPADGWTMADMADDGMAVMKAAGMSRAHVIGISMGGMIAQELTLNFPENVKTLTLISTHTGGPEIAPPTPDALDVLVNKDLSIPVEKMVEKTWRTICAPGFLDVPGRLETCLRMDLDKPTPLEMLAHQAVAIAESDRSERLANIKVPTLVVTGLADPLVPPANSHRLAALIPGSKLETIAECGHMVPLEKPKDLADIILPFLNENG